MGRSRHGAQRLFGLFLNQREGNISKIEDVGDQPTERVQGERRNGLGAGSL